MQKIEYPCKIDASMQPAVVRFATGDEARPLLVALHTWSCDENADSKWYEECCAKYNWNMIFPRFRGPNSTPEACCSEYVVSDLEDAVSYMKLVSNVDLDRVYLTGGSGGGMCALYMAGRRPDLWTAVSAWCPISDLLAWYKQCNNTRFACYSRHIEGVLGKPEQNESFAQEARMRSPLTWLQNAINVPIDISTGIHDGHTGSVPVSQAFNAFNALALPDDRIRDDYIDYIVEKEQMPAPLRDECQQDPSYMERTVHFRRQSRNARITLFEGTHEIFCATACQWLSKQARGKKIDWQPGEAIALTGKTELTK
ncbi:MAG: prolyl oligopeptidase family serine peptidase [Victivallales bacterium]|nr:prolyl oligopeptidase family serine peptidase [Victivallales bacterium]